MPTVALLKIPFEQTFHLILSFAEVRAICASLSSFVRIHNLAQNSFRHIKPFFKKLMDAPQYEIFSFNAIRATINLYNL